MVGRIGPLATRNREPGQARKGAAAAVDAGAGVWLMRFATSFLNSCVSRYVLSGSSPKVASSQLL